MSRDDKSKRSRNRQSAFTNPVLVGAMTLLVIMVAVFLSYNANNGLPFVPTRELKVDIASGSDLVAGNEVREGGFRIGLVQELKPIELKTGQVAAQLTLQLQKAYGNVPVNSTVAIRPRSALGLKFIDLHLGSAKKVFSDGAVMPITQTRVPVQFEDVFQAFDPRTRRAIDENLVGFGDALAGRGSALNDTIAALPSLLGHLQPVAAYLSDPNTQLTRLFDNLEGFMGTVAPVAGVNAHLFTDMATTFEAIGRDPNALEQTIAKSPRTEDVSIDSLKVQRPFLVDFNRLGQQLAPATASLKSSLPIINPAVEQGTKTLIRTPVLNTRLQGVMTALQNLSRAPGTNVAINGLQSTVAILNPMIRYLGPYQTVCDDWNYFWTYLSEHISEQTSFGFAQRVLLNMGNPLQANSVGTQGATAPVNGGGSTSVLTGGDEFLHAQAYGAAIDTQGNADCETGQRGYPKKLNYLDPQGRNLASDAHTPGDQGPTFKGRAHVPTGETFTRNPQTGPQLAYNPTNP
jgi:virulence factor Mce-like protein